MDHHRRARAAAGARIVAPAAAIVVLTVTCALAIHRAVAAGDAASVAFVGVSYGALLLLLRSLRAYELALGDADDRGPLRRRVWALSALLTAMFAWKVAAVVPWWPAAVIVWAAAAATSAGGFFALSLHRRP
ncbi:hypothetical protein BS78_10G039300 [Paspalum vaginatum]|nr:hypothetical protein BS78_10G039300 [Paspalum vaginatum]